TADRARRQAAQRQMARFLRRFAVVGQGESQKRVDLVEKVFIDLAQRFKDRAGGYTRIMKLGRRRGDNAPMTLIEFVDAGASKADTKPEPAAAKAEAAETGKAEAGPAKAESAKSKAEAKPEAEASAEAKPEAEGKPQKAAVEKPAKKSDE